MATGKELVQFLTVPRAGSLPLVLESYRAGQQNQGFTRPKKELSKCSAHCSVGISALQVRSLSPTNL